MAASSTSSKPLSSNSSSASLASDLSSLCGIPGNEKDDSELCALENILKSIPTPSNGSSPTPSMELELKGGGEEEPLVEELSSSESDGEGSDNSSLADLRPPSEEEEGDEDLDVEEAEEMENKQQEVVEEQEVIKKPEKEDKPEKGKTRKRKRKGDKKNAKGEKKKKKSKTANERKNIRSIMKEGQLDKETLNAQQEEMERIRRIQELKKNALSLEAQMAHMYQTSASKAEAAEAEQSRPKDSFLKSLLESAEDEAKTATTKSGEDIILLDSGDESKAQRLKAKDRDVIDISSDEEDVMVSSDQEDSMEPEDDPNNSGSHVNDDMNQPDQHGRVLVNVGHPPDEPDIFLAPQLARAVKPHQIGGIRFLYDNLVESLERYKTSNGFGCILAHSMGLGKTLQVISFIDIFLRYSDARTVLCIVPINTLQNWIAEFNKWIPKQDDMDSEGGSDDHVQGRHFYVHIVNDNHKTTFARAAVIEEWYTKGGVLLMGYEMYRLLSSRRGHIAKPKRTKKGETLVIDVEEEDKNKGLLIDIHQGLIKPGPDLVICDEGHRIKNAHASTSQSLKSIRTRRRVVLTGYPLQNNLMEYWCMVDFVRPNFLGNKTEFSNMFERPIMNGQCADSTPQDVRLMRFRAHVLHSLLEGFVQRRGHAVLRSALPPKEEYVLFVRLSPIQRRLYAEFMKLSDSVLITLANNNPLKAFAVCCKIWNHPDTLYQTMKSQRAVDDNDDLDLFADADGTNKKKGRGGNKDSAGKSPVRNGGPNTNTEDSLISMIDKKEQQTISYEWAEPLLTDYKQGLLENSGKMLVMFQIIKQSMSMGDKCLIFSQSLLTLNLIEEFLGMHTLPLPGSTEKWAKNKNYFRLDGSTSGCDREKLINQFNAPFQNKYHLFLLSTRAGCLGINLIGANRVIIFDASWNPCHDCQAVCRVYRYGQTKCCFVYRLVSNNTMEKKIYERQINKQGMSDRVVDEMNIQNNFTRRQVESLLTFDNKEEPILDTTGCEYRYPDKVIISCLKELGYWITKEPFTHESLLIDRKDQKLTKMEKRLAKQSYEEEKKLKVSYSRPSYAAYYPKNMSNMPSHIPRYAQLPNPNRPVASVRPIMSTPLPMQLKSQGEGGEGGFPINNLQRPGVFVQQVKTTTDISIPGTVSTSESGARAKIPAGETVLVIKTPKGVYIRTSEGKIFAVRSAGSKFDGLQVSAPDTSSAPPSQSTSTSSTTSLSFGGVGGSGGGMSRGMYQSAPWMNSSGFSGGSMYSNMMPRDMPGMYPGMKGKPMQPKMNKSLTRAKSDQRISSPTMMSLDSQSSMSSAGNADSPDPDNKDGKDSPEVKIVSEKQGIKRVSSLPGMSPNMGMNYPGFGPYSQQGFNMPPYHMGMMPQVKPFRKSSDAELNENSSDVPQESNGKDMFALSSQGLLSGGKAFIPSSSSSSSGVSSNNNSGTNASSSLGFSQHLPASAASSSSSSSASSGRKNFSEKFPMAKQGLESLLSSGSEEPAVSSENTLAARKHSVSSAGDGCLREAAADSVREMASPEPSRLRDDHHLPRLSSESQNSDDGKKVSDSMGMLPSHSDDRKKVSDSTGMLASHSGNRRRLSDSKGMLPSHSTSHWNSFGGQSYSHLRSSHMPRMSYGNPHMMDYSPFSSDSLAHSRSMPSFPSNMGLYNYQYRHPSQMHMFNPVGGPGSPAYSSFPGMESMEDSELPDLTDVDLSQTASKLPSSSQSSM